jgi:hypothetical protein
VFSSNELFPGWLIVCLLILVSQTVFDSASTPVSRKVAIGIFLTILLLTLMVYNLVTVLLFQFKSKSPKDLQEHPISMTATQNLAIDVNPTNNQLPHQ